MNDLKQKLTFISRMLIQAMIIIALCIVATAEETAKKDAKKSTFPKEVSMMIKKKFKGVKVQKIQSCEVSTQKIPVIGIVLMTPNEEDPKKGLSAHIAYKPGKSWKLM